MADAPSILQRFGGVFKSVNGDGHEILRRIVKTSKEMLADRGYTGMKRAPDVVEAVVAGEPVLTADGVAVYIHGEEKVGVKFARAVLDSGLPRCVVVSLEGPTPFTRKEFENSALQFLLAKQMCVNVTHHALVPKHERTTEPPRGVAIASLPLLLTTDPVVQYYDWPEGTVVKIHRAFSGHEPVPYYRVVASPQGVSAT